MPSLEELLARLKRTTRHLALALACTPLFSSDAAPHPYETSFHEEPAADAEPAPANPKPQPGTHEYRVVQRGENLWSIVKEHYGLASEQAIRERTIAVCDANIGANTSARERYARDTRMVTYDPRTNEARVMHAPDGIACDELEPGDALALPAFDVAAVPRNDTNTNTSIDTGIEAALRPDDHEQPSKRTTLLLGAGLAALGAGATYLATRGKSYGTPGPASIDDAITLYLGNYAHGNEKDKTVKDIVRETGVSASRLYRALNERGIPTRKELAKRAREYVAEKLATVRERGESVSAAASSYGVSGSTANRLVQQYTL